MMNPTNKVYLDLMGQPVIKYSLDVFEQLDDVQEMIVVAHRDEMEYMRSEIIDRFRYRKVKQLVCGGGERQDSVNKGLEALDNGLRLVAVHDGARPLLSRSLALRVIEAARAFEASCPGLKVKETVRRLSDDDKTETIDRSRLFLVQTPQVFRLEQLRKAYKKAREDGFYATDDASLFERYCGPVKMVEGEYRNIKITTAEDMDIAKGLLAGGESLRIGSGYDVHRLAEGRELIIGGVKIPFDQGLLGHSDADVLAHALCDALLGAGGLPDIGHQFPDHDAQYRDINSLILLKRVAVMIQQTGFAIGNIDSVIIAEQPRMAPYLGAMKKNLAEALGIDAARINIKATTTEGLGFTGRGEGIAAQATVLLEQRKFGL
jgi:2-C-methyl-D-erythritol 2,4-cyclodiphosphate synthase/2-C-methyl-D-erythritol 4-phosphate cytidylyltransferase